MQIARFVASSAFMVFCALAFGCKDSTSSQTSAAPLAAERCNLLDLGEASDLPDRKTIPDRQLVKIDGISDPKTLIWKDETTDTAYYACKIMGTAGRFFYMQVLPVGQEPKILSVFEGTIYHWKSLDQTIATPMSAAFKQQWNAIVDVDNSYLLKGGEKPEGCK